MLANAGVKRCYGIVGDALNPTMKALLNNKDIEYVHVRHEEWGALAASAEGFFTGEPVAVCGTAGPGVTHLINGLLDAERERCPVIAIAGDIVTSAFDLHVIEAIDPKKLFETASLYTARCVNPHQAVKAFTEGIRTAILDRGPVVLALPGDVASAPSPGLPTTLMIPGVPVPEPTAQDLATIVDLVNGAKKITIFGGDGCRDAKAEVIELATKLKAPVGFSYKGKQWLESENPHAVGMTALLGYGGCFHAIKHADVVLMLGTDFPFPEFLQAGKAKIIQVDSSAHRLGRTTAITAGSVSDVGAFCRALLPQVAEKSDSAHLESALKISEEWKHRLNAYVTDGDKRKPIRPEYVAATLNELMDDDAIVTADVGTCNIWASHHIEFSGNRRHFTSFNWATMACASPNAFGASKAYPGRQVVALCGDGGFSMLAFGDLITEVQHKARVVHVIIDNGALDFVEIEMQEAGMAPVATDLENPNFAKIADAFGAKGIRVEEPGELRGALIEALAHKDGPVVVDVVTDRSALSIPSHIPRETAVGFTLGEFRRLLRGDTSEVLDNVTHNWRLVLP